MGMRHKEKNQERATRWKKNFIKNDPVAPAKATIAEVTFDLNEVINTQYSFIIIHV